jgi:hypothetical protein
MTSFVFDVILDDKPNSMKTHHESLGIYLLFPPIEIVSFNRAL